MFEGLTSYSSSSRHNSQAIISRMVPTWYTRVRPSELRASSGKYILPDTGLLHSFHPRQWTSCANELMSRLRALLLPTTFLLSIHLPCKEIPVRCPMVLMLPRSTHMLRMLLPWLRVRCFQLLQLTLIRYANTPYLQASTNCDSAQLPSLRAIRTSPRESNGLPTDNSRLLHSRSLA
jgi:hypothetical protein